ncbi:carbonic anhydrase [Auriculariales sp. MPI-PUGE-AT-0066]|nr:carbonic anhydrase [Auriculariales sp. MPI-PUGE-AT-0066]
MSYNFTEANAPYAATFDKGDLDIPPAKKLLIITCMDARIDTGKAFGLSEGHAHVVRNAGGRAVDAIRNVLISQRLLGTREIAVVHHTKCGMFLFQNPDLRGILSEAHPDHKADIQKIEFFPLEEPIEKGVREDVKFLKEHPLVLKETVITGWVFDVASGKVTQVV